MVLSGKIKKWVYLVTRSGPFWYPFKVGLLVWAFMVLGLSDLLPSMASPGRFSQTPRMVYDIASLAKRGDNCVGDCVLVALF